MIFRKKIQLPRNKGKLVVFEGIDGSGKTTLAKLLVDKLNLEQSQSVYLNEPSNLKYGILFRKLIAKHNTRNKKLELKYLELDRKENLVKNIIPNLEKNKIVVLDRYYYSTIVYQSDTYSEMISIFKKQQKLFPEPDILIHISCSLSTALDRINKRENIDILENQKTLSEIIYKYNQILPENKILINNNNEDNINNVVNAIYLQILEKLK